jgi:hypothetical protein
MLPGFLGLFMLSCFPCFDIHILMLPNAWLLCVSYASGRDVSGAHSIHNLSLIWTLNDNVSLRSENFQFSSWNC